MWACVGMGAGVSVCVGGRERERERERERGARASLVEGAGRPKSLFGSFSFLFSDPLLCLGLLGLGLVLCCGFARAFVVVNGCKRSCGCLCACVACALFLHLCPCFVPYNLGLSVRVCVRTYARII